MEFNHYRDCYSVYKKDGWTDDNIVANCRINKTPHVIHEMLWSRYRKPYYNVWPTIIPILEKIQFNFSAKYIRLPMHCLSIRFPKHDTQFSPLTSVMFAAVFRDEEGYPCISATQDDLKNEIIGFTFYYDYGESYHSGHMTFPERTALNIRIDSEKSVEDAINSQGQLPEWGNRRCPEYLNKQMNRAAKLCIALGLIANDPSLINPDVLAKDESAWNEAENKGDIKQMNLIADRAFRRRGPGWEIGKKYEEKPIHSYVVPPHPQLYWTGKGRELPIIKVRKGYSVSRDLMLQIPTGYEDDEPA